MTSMVVLYVTLANVPVPFFLHSPRSSVYQDTFVLGEQNTPVCRSEGGGFALDMKLFPKRPNGDAQFPVLAVGLYVDALRRTGKSMEVI